MLTTGFDECQGNLSAASWEIPQLAAGSEYVASPAFSDEDVDSCPPKRGLKLKNIMFRRAAETTSRKFIERDEIHFAPHALQEGR